MHEIEQKKEKKAKRETYLHEGLLGLYIALHAIALLILTNFH